MGEVATKEMCAFCFECVQREFEPNLPSRFAIRNDDKFPLFVTWTKRGNLRGCIGTFSATPLADGLRDYALTSAFRDSRFSPMQRHEVAQLECAVSLLHSFEQGKDAYDWEVGTHGINISFSAGGRSYRATYLPEVAPEQGWNKEETLASLVRKAGFNGRPQQVLAAMSLTRYQSSKVHLTFEEYTQMLQS